MTNFAELIERLEKAVSGSRELELDLALAIDHKACGGNPRWESIRAGVKQDGRGKFDKDSLGFVSQIPRWTRSIDAALALVPDGHRWLLDKRPDADKRQDGYRAQVYRQGHPYKSDNSDLPTAWAKTPALALCIAALRARSA